MDEQLTPQANETKNSRGWKHHFTTVTPLSKFLAMMLFVLLPFAGFAIGLKYGESELNQSEEKEFSVRIPTGGVEQENLPRSTNDGGIEDISASHQSPLASPDSEFFSTSTVCGGAVYEWAWADATSSPSGRYEVFRNYQNSSFCVKDIQEKIDTEIQLNLPKGWQYDHFSNEEDILYYQTGFYELGGIFSDEERRVIELEAKELKYGLHELNLVTGQDTLVTPWSW